MKKKKIWRYYCDFCKKSGCSKYHMARHEKRCTLNPDRECGVCEMLEKAPPELSVLLAMLPNPDDFHSVSEFGGETYVDLSKAVSDVLPRLREESENCPACILAALRQAQIPVPCVEDFNFSEEMKSLFEEFNKETPSDGSY